MFKSASSSGMGKDEGLKAWLFVLLFLLVLVVFHPALSGELLDWDDNYSLGKNPHLNASGWSLFKWIFTDTTYMWRYQPLCWLTWSAIYKSFGFQPFYFHLIILLLHGLNAGLVFLLIRRLLILGCPASLIKSPNQISICAALGAALWAVHPLRVETTAWAVELVFVQPLFFLLLSLLAYLKCGGSARRPASQFYWAGFILFVASLISYPLAIGGFVVFVALDIYPLKRLSLNPMEWGTAASRRVWIEKIPFLIVVLLVGCFNLYVRGQAHSEVFSRPPSLSEFSVTSRLMQAFYIWACNLWKPWLPFHLTPMPTSLMDFNPWALPFILSATLVVGLSIMLFVQRRRWPAAFCLWLCHLALLVPMLGLSEHPHFPSDRYSLAVSISWSVLLAGVLMRFWPQLQIRRALIALLAILIPLLGVMSYRQTFVWQTNIGLFRRLILEIGGRPKLALVSFNLNEQLAEAYYDQGRFPEAIETLQIALRIMPNSARIHYKLGLALTSAGNVSGAIEELNQAVHIEPDFAVAHNKLGLALAGRGDIKGAVECFRRTIQSDPKDSDGYCNLALALTQMHHGDEAIGLYRQALVIDPGKVGALNNFAWLLAVNPDVKVRNGTEAVRLAEQACQLTDYRDPVILGTLGAAYAEAGRFADAVVAGQKAESLATATGDKELMERSHKMVELYKSGRPYHEPDIR